MDPRGKARAWHGGDGKLTEVFGGAGEKPKGRGGFK